MKKTICIFLLSAGCFCSSVAQEPDSTSLTRVGNQVPDFSVELISGEIIQMENLRGKVVLLNFFATWCPPCRQEMPVLEKKVWNRWRNSDFQLISIGREHTKEEVAAFIKEKGFTFPMGYDPERDIYKKFATAYIPRNYVIDRDGQIVYQTMGYTEEEFQKILDLLAKLIKK